MHPVEDARALVAERFPAARAAFLGGGILSARRTATSDLDIVVVLTGPPAPYRESLRWRGWPAETFVHDADSLEYFFGKDTARRRPTLARMCADGVVLAGRREETDLFQERARSILAAGPPPLSSAELDFARYGLTDLLDDLAGSTDAGDRGDRLARLDRDRRTGPDALRALAGHQQMAAARATGGRP